MNEVKDKINLNSAENTFRYANETFSGCDMTAAITININSYDEKTKTWTVQPYTRVLGELQTVSYSIHMEKRPVRSIGNVNAKDYVMGPRTIAGSLVFSVFNKHFAEDIISKVNSNYSAGTAFLVDELPPFDITISAANEYGYRSSLTIYGVRLLNEGQVMSINDVYTENTYQYFATDIQYLTGEMFYVRDKVNQMYKLTDISLNNKQNSDEQYEIIYPYAAKSNVVKNNVLLKANIKNPTRENGYGIVNFSITPFKENGNIIITSDNNYHNIEIKEAGDKESNSFYISLPPDKYIAYYKEDDSVSESICFNIKNYNQTKTLSCSPTIENVTSTSIEIFCNDSSHNKATLYLEEDVILDINNDRCLFNNLKPNTEYIIFTHNDENKSKEVKIKTLANDNGLHEELINYCYANSKLFLENNIKDIYIPLIKEAVELKNSSDTIADSLIKLRHNYDNKIQELKIDNNEYKELYEKYNNNINFINELIIIAIKINNDYLKAINDEDTNFPKIIKDEYFNHIFIFNDDFVSAEIYEINNNKNKFIRNLNKNDLNIINGVKNSYKYIGKAGTKYYMQCFYKNKKSYKFEFYIMTEDDKEKSLKIDLAKDKILEKNKEIIQNKILEEIEVSNDQNFNRAFMINAKKVDNPIFLPPCIDYIDDDVFIKTNIYNCINNRKESFYIAIATNEDIINDNDIYKTKFYSEEEVIQTSKIFNRFEKDKEYCIWIEDSNFNQISNASTFIYNKEFKSYEDEIKDYEIKDVINNIKNISYDLLPLNIYEDIVGVLENDQFTNSCTLILNVLTILFKNSLSRNVICSFLNLFKYYIGIINYSSTMFNNIEYKDNILSFNSSHKGSLSVIKINNYCDQEVCELNYSNIIDIKDNEIVLLIAINESLDLKSELILINNKEKYMEVI